MKEIYSWQEIIDNKDISEISLVGYGSLLNKETHHTNTSSLVSVKVNGFRREFTLTYGEDRCTSKSYNQRFLKSANSLSEDYNNKHNKLSYINNSGSLNVRIDKNNNINGLLLDIERKDFASYADRERQYNLVKVDVELFNENDIAPEYIYILVSENDSFVQDLKIYYLYQKTCRNGAYSISNKFGEFYDQTTFDNKKRLAYMEINERFFKPGTELVIKQNLITINKFPGETENIIKNDNENCIILTNRGYLAEVLIKSTGEKLWIDTGDLSLL